MAEENSGTDKKYPYDELRYGNVDIGALSPAEIREYAEKERKTQIRNAAIVGAVLFALGLIFIIAGAASRESGYIGSGIGWMIIGLVVGLAWALSVRRKDTMKLARKGVDKANSSNERMHSILANKMHDEMDDPARPIYRDFYQEWQALREMGVYPQTFVNGCRCNGCEPVDILVDETDGKMAVCSYYTASILGVYDTKKIIGCELQNNGTVVYKTTTDGGISRGIVGGILAGGVGAVIASSTARKRTTEERTDDYKVIVVYDDLNATGISFEFDDNRALAENVYRVFTILERRNHGLAGVADEDIFKDM